MSDPVKQVKALSIRQPWAWLIVNGLKDIENRDWKTKFRGRFLVHAGKTMTKDDYESCADFAAMNGVELPSASELKRGGIVGAADLIDCVDDSESDWFVGDYGFVLSKPGRCNFIPLKGKLGFFDVPLNILQKE